MEDFERWRVHAAIDLLMRGEKATPARVQELAVYYMSADGRTGRSGTMAKRDFQAVQALEKSRGRDEILRRARGI